MNRKLIIQTLSDDDYNYIINHYNKSNTQYGSGSSKWYFIPPLLVKSECWRRKLEVTYNSELITPENWMNWISSNTGRFRRVLSDCCNLTLQQYYDTVVLHIRYEDERPKCSICGDPLEFRCLAWGYHGDSRDYNDYICYKHSTFDNGGRELGHKTRFLNKGNPNDECYLYLALGNGYLKYGITENMDKRIEMQNTLYCDPFIKYDILMISNRLNIGNIEDEIKKVMKHEKFSYDKIELLKELTINISKSYDVIFNIDAFEIFKD